LQDKQVRALDKTRLVMLFSLQFGDGHESKVRALVATMVEAGIPERFATIAGKRRKGGGGLALA
jgi:hypothetical protein